MPEFILPAEADRCPHCEAVLRIPPECCEEMIREHSDDMHRENNPHIDWNLFGDFDDEFYGEEE